MAVHQEPRLTSPIEWPPAQHLSTGQPSMSSNPLVDYHSLCSAAMILLAPTYAGNTWGLGRIWAQLPIVHRDHWLLWLPPDHKGGAADIGGAPLSLPQVADDAADWGTTATGHAAW
jgi:hypothetical protein